jgi:hypothetical protein
VPTSDNFAVGVFITSDIEEAKAAHTPEAFAAMDRVHVIANGQPLGIVVILKGYKPTSNDFILEGDCEFLAADGTDLAEAEIVRLTSGTLKAKCYKTTFGNWKCFLMDTAFGLPHQDNVPPPS